MTASPKTIQMVTQDLLNLRLMRLKGTEEWSLPPGRLSFVFPQGRPVQFVSGLKANRLAPGDVLVVNSTGAGKVCAPAGAELSFWSFAVRLENLYPLFAGCEIARLQSVIDDFKGIKWYSAAQPVAAECHRLLRHVTPQVDLRHRSKLLQIVAVILSAEFKHAHRQHPGFVSQEQHVMQVFESLSGAEILDLSMDALAARFGCSRRHLNRLFHQFFGCAVATLRLELRLLKAASRLEHPNAKVITVAVDCGFNHLGVFNACFKRRFGVTPGAMAEVEGHPNPESAPRFSAPPLALHPAFHRTLFVVRVMLDPSDGGRRKRGAER